MTTVNVNVTDVAGAYGPNDKVIFYSPVYREGNSGEIISTAETVFSLQGGPGTVELKPGPVRVKFQVQGIADIKDKEGTVPDEGTVDLFDVIAGSFTYTPEVVGAAQAASNAAILAATSAKTFRDEAFTYSIDAAADADVAATKASEAESAAWRAEMAIGQVKVTESPPGSGLWSFNSAVLDVEETAPDSGLYTIEVAYA